MILLGKNSFLTLRDKQIRHGFSLWPIIIIWQRHNIINFVKIFKKKVKVGSQLSSDPNIKNLEQTVSDKTGLSVSIKNNPKNKGTITFFYHDIDQLNKIIDVIKSKY